MASGPLLGGGGGGDGSREKSRWAESKVYTRKSHKSSSSKPSSAPPHQQSNSAAGSNPQQPLLPPSPDANSSHHHHNHHHHNEDASSLNHTGYAAGPSAGNHNHHLPNGRQQQHHRSLVTFNLSACSRHEARELRRKLAAELEHVRLLVRRLESREVELAAVAPPSNPATGYTLSQLSASDPKTPALVARHTNSEAASAPLRRQLSVSVAQGMEAGGGEGLEKEKEKRTPKANQLYRNSDFLLGKDRLPPAESNKKAKLSSGKKFTSHEQDRASLQKLYAPALKSCGTLLARLMKHRFSWVFNTPVDVKGLGLHDYYIVIKQPMDLGTIKSRLGKSFYKHPREFSEDVRLTFHNAMTYNPRGQDVHYMAEQLSQLFEDQWAPIEAECALVTQPPAPKKPPPPLPLPMDAQTLERSDSTLHLASESRTAKSAGHIPYSGGRPPAMKKPKAKDLHKRDMTYEEKQRLSSNLQNLPSEKLDNIVQIIKKRNSSLSQHDDEIEVDIDSVDAETLWELDRFVTNYKKSLSKNKRKAELAIQARREAEHNMEARVQERVPQPASDEVPEGIKTDEKYLTSSSPVRVEKKGDNVSESSSSSSSSSDSGSSSSDSDSGTSSGYGSDGQHSPR